MISLRQINVPTIQENMQKKISVRKKIRLQVYKIGKKKIKIPHRQQALFSAKTDSLIFMKIYRNEVQIEKICRILENLRKNFFYWKKIQLQVSKKIGFLFKFPMGNRRFFETTSEAKCPDKPRSGVAKLFYLNDQSCTFCAEKVCTKAFLLERLVLHVLC